MKKNETGRSMVEMLGVLAITGVITIGGISGYRTLMNKMTAGTIADAIADVSVAAQTQNKCLFLTDLAENFEGNPKCVDSMQGSATGQVKIVFSKECEAIEKMVELSFGKCRWEADGERSYLFIPGGSSECTKDGCSASACEPYTKDKCLG